MQRVNLDPDLDCPKCNSDLFGRTIAKRVKHTFSVTRCKGLPSTIYNFGKHSHKQAESGIPIVAETRSPVETPVSSHRPSSQEVSSSSGFIQVSKADISLSSQSQGDFQCIDTPQRSVSFNTTSESSPVQRESSTTPPNPRYSVSQSEDPQLHQEIALSLIHI